MFYGLVIIQNISESKHIRTAKLYECDITVFYMTTNVQKINIVWSGLFFFLIEDDKTDSASSKWLLTPRDGIPLMDGLIP